MNLIMTYLSLLLGVIAFFAGIFVFQIGRFGMPITTKIIGLMSIFLGGLMVVLSIWKF